MKNTCQKELLIAVIFIVAIILPASDVMFKLDKFTYLPENRELAKTPIIQLSINAIQKFPARYTAYFNDHFGFRNALVRANFIIRHDFLGGSPSKQVIIGKNGWYFYTGEGEIEDYRGITKFTPNKLENWAKTLEIKNDFLKKRGIKYVFVVAPNKSTVYGEHLPTSYSQVRKRTAIDDFVDYLRSHTTVEIMDLRSSLLPAKSQERLYHKTDTHWNDYGAFIAYRQIMQPVLKSFPSLKVKALDDYTVERPVGPGLGLASMIGGVDFINEEYVNLRPIKGKALKVSDINNEAKSPVSSEQNDSSLPRVVVFRDSFFSSVAPFFSEHFQYAMYYWQSWNSSTKINKILSEQKPDIVIEEIVERYIKYRMADFIESPPDLQ